MCSYWLRTWRPIKKNTLRNFLLSFLLDNPLYVNTLCYNWSYSPIKTLQVSDYFIIFNMRHTIEDKRTMRNPRKKRKRHQQRELKRTAVMLFVMSVPAQTSREHWHPDSSWEICQRCAKILLAAEHKIQLA